MAELRRMTPEELSETALKMVKHEVYLMWVAEPDFINVFAAFMFWDGDTKVLESCGGAYAPVSAALPRGINGKPMFMECTLIHREDCDPLYEKYQELEKALADATGVDPA